MKMKRVSIKRLFLLFKQLFLPALFSSRNMISWLTLSGVKIGKGCRFYRPSIMMIDVSRPASLVIGDYAKITGYVKILAHDYSYSVARRAYGDILNRSYRTVIGDNVFLGMGSIVLPGAVIGNNVIIGAGSIVWGEIPDNVVAAGNPAEVICSLEEYYTNRKQNLKVEAKKEYMLLKDYYGRRPTVKEMGNFYPLFIEHSLSAIKKEKVRTNFGGDNEKEVIEYLLSTKSVFSDYEEFYNWAEAGEIFE